MKTKDRIMLTSLTLFNSQGENNITTVDIATEMDISPGNLYYHFKGKEAIIEQLYLAMEHEMLDVLQAPLKDDIDVENVWFYLYIVFEQIHKYRFFYRNITDILYRYPKINKRFKRILKKKRETARATLILLEQKNILSPHEDEVHDSYIDNLADNITLLLTYWMSYIELDQNSDATPALSIHRGVFQVMSLIAPYLQDHYQSFYLDCKTLFNALNEELGKQKQ